MGATRKGKSLEAGSVDLDMVKATTEADTRRHLIEDGLDPDNPLAGMHQLVSIARLRHQIGLSQAKFAMALRIPVKTLRNWEQRVSSPDPVAQAFFTLVADDPERAFKVLAG